MTYMYKVFIGLSSACLSPSSAKIPQYEYLFVLVLWLCGMRDLSSATRYQTHIPCSGSTKSQPWTTRASPLTLYFPESTHYALLS